MTDFFDTMLWCVRGFTSILFSLPFMDDFSFGDMLVAVIVLGILIVSLVGSLRVVKF